MTEEANGDVWSQLYDDPKEAADLRRRSELMFQIEKLIIARVGDISKKDIIDVLGGKINKLTVKRLVKIKAHLLR